MNLIGYHAGWEKLSGKPNASMRERKGFGCVSFLEVGYRMVITGDFGVTTSIVKLIENTAEGVKVYTSNSIYLVTKW